MSSADETNLAGWVWEQHCVWSNTADRFTRNLDRVRMTALVLTVLAAVLITVGPALKLPDAGAKWFSWGAFVCTSLVALMQTFIGPAKMQDRMRARSVSESLKSAVFVYLAGVAPYRGADRDTLFRHNIDAVLADVADLSDRTIDVQAGNKALPPVHDVESYISARVEGQIQRYYRPKSGVMRRRAQVFRVVGTALAVVAALVSANAAVFGTDWAAWLPVITTASAALAAEVAVGRYSELAVEYARACAELERVLRDRRFSTARDQAADDALVAAAERVISQQNEAWMARGLATYASAGTPKAPSIPQPGSA